MIKKMLISMFVGLSMVVLIVNAMDDAQEQLQQDDQAATSEQPADQEGERYDLVEAPVDDASATEQAAAEDSGNEADQQGF